MANGGGGQRGRTRPYKVGFQYPGQKAHVRTEPTLDAAERAAGEMAQRGAIVAVTYAPKGAEPALMARFGPNQGHTVALHAVTDSPLLTCSCGRGAESFGEIDDHMMRAGICRFCWGATTVRGAPGGILAGTEVDCPICGGTGRDADASYHDVETALYIPAPQRLIGEAGGR